MLSAEAHVETERASRYLIQLCRHARQMGQHRPHRPRTHDGTDTQTPPEVRHVEWSDTYGIVSLSVGRLTMQATPDTLTLHAEATTEEKLQRIQDLLARRLETIGRRDHLTVNWERLEPAAVHQLGEPDSADDPGPEDVEKGVVARRGHRGMVLTTVGALGVALAAAVHLGLGGSVLVASRWMDWTAVGLVIVPLVAVLGHAAVPMIVNGVRRLATRRNKARHRTAHIRAAGHHDRHR
ncbi:MAG: DUF2218 domain-containing protein [Actinobacteria bacterium]|nr:DUF2218 domain-containing protein [Actinomycetota bacterium]